MGSANTAIFHCETKFCNPCAGQHLHGDCTTGGTYRKPILCLLLILILIFPAATALAAKVTLAWDPNSEPELKGYKVHYGTTSGAYTHTKKVGNQTTCTVKRLTEGTTYYFAVTAYSKNAKSGYSTEISYQVPNIPVVSLNAPNGGEVIPARSTFMINWNASPEARRFDLRYSLNKGRKWKLIANRIPGMIYPWRVPDTIRDKHRCRVKVTAYDNLDRVLAKDRSDSTFTIERFRRLRLKSPNGGENIGSGRRYTIKWSTAETGDTISQIMLMLSTDRGKTWNLIDTLDDNRGTYPWDVPRQSKDFKNKSRIRVYGYGATGQLLGKAISKKPFTLEAFEEAKLTSPDGGEILTSKKPYKVKWDIDETNIPPFTHIELYYSLAGRGKWKKIIMLQGNPGNYTWLPPNVKKPKLKCRVLVKLKNEIGKTVSQDISDANFSINP